MAIAQYLETISCRDKGTKSSMRQSILWCYLGYTFGCCILIKLCLRMWRFFKDFMVYGVASMFGKLAAIFLMPVYTGILTKEEYGAMALITSVKGIIDLVSNLNIHSGIARDYYEEGIDRKKLISTGFLSIMSLSLTVMLVGLLTRNFWSGNVLGLSEVFSPAFMVMLMTIPAGSLMSYFAILTRYKKKPVLFSVGTILQLLIQIGISVIGVAVLRAGIISIFLGVFISEVAAVLYFGILNREYISFQFDKSLLKRALIFALPTLPAILAGWLDSSMGQILIGKYVSVEDLGVYSVALSLASVFTLISTSFQNVWSPFLYENYKKTEFKRDIRRLFSIMALSLVMVTLLLSMFSREIVLLLSNDGYLEACRYITLLCIPMSFYLMLPFASSGVFISRDTKYVAISNIVGSCGNLLFLFLTIRFLGVQAVPLCLAVSRITTYFILYKVSEKKISYRLPNFMLIIIIAVVGVCYMILLLDLPLWQRVLLTLVSVAGVISYISIRFDLRGMLVTLTFKTGTGRKL